MLSDIITDVATWRVLGLSISGYGTIALTYVISKIVLSLRYTPYNPGSKENVLDTITASVIIPEYNEDPELFEQGLQSVLAQANQFNEIWVIDDGSSDQRAWDIATEYAQHQDILNVHRFTENQGKRRAQAYGFHNAAPVDVFITMDSDTVLQPGTLRELLIPFSDDKVTAVTGYPTVINSETNVLTRLIDMRYWVAFNVERATQSMFGTVICCCGVLSAYRSDVILANVDAYASQTFLGRECTFGDDRRLTAYALRSGKVVYQRTALSLTAAPETLSEYLTQQIRWMRSFWRESLLALQWAPRRSKVLTTMLVIDLLLPFALVFLGFGSILSQTRITSRSIPILYLGIVIMIAYLRNVRYSQQDLWIYVLSPVYAALYLLILLPLSFYALATIRSNSWGTR